METGGPQTPNTEPGTPEPGYRPVRAAKTSSAPVVIILALVVVAIALGAMWYFVWSITPPDQVVKAYAEAMKKVDLKAVGQYLIASDKKEWDKMIKNVSKEELEMGKGMMPTYKVGATEYKDDRAIVQTKQQLPEMIAQLMGRKEIDAPFVLVKEDRAWKIDMKASSQEQQKANKDLMPQGM